MHRPPKILLADIFTYFVTLTFISTHIQFNGRVVENATVSLPINTTNDERPELTQPEQIMRWRVLMQKFHGTLGVIFDLCLKLHVVQRGAQRCDT